MRKKDNQKQQPEQCEKPPRLTYEQITHLASGIAMGLANAEDTTSAGLMLLMDDIANHIGEDSQAETIANLLKSYIFMWTASEHNKAEAAYIESQRAAFFDAQEGGRA